MSIDIRLPNINAPTQEGQLGQVRSYLYQLAQQLRWALSAVENGADGTSGSSGSSVSGVNGVNGAAAGKDALTPGSVSGEAGQLPEGTGSDPAATFNSIKSLIIKSADIVNAYYETINARLKGEYLSQSQFGSYTEQMALELSANAQAISQYYTDMQRIASGLEEIRDQTHLTESYIKTGLLYYGTDGSPTYGLEIGQTNRVDGVSSFDKFARFTADRLSFYDRNDTEVAYISDYKLYISNAEVVGSLRIGGYVMDSSDGLAFKWTE